MTKPKMTRSNDIVAIARAGYEAYVAKDRSAIEKLIAEDFHFTSPLDNRIDRATYFARCWPNSKGINGFEFINLVSDGERVFVTYEGHRKSGESFRNTEIVTVREGQIVEVEVYSGGPFHTKLNQAASYPGMVMRGSDGSGGCEQ